MKRLFVITAFLFGITLQAGAIPNQITYQGTLKQKGSPVTGTRNMRFRFVDAAGADLPGTAPINRANVPVTQGLFALQLPLDPKVNWQAYSPYIEISIEGQALSPNQPLTSNLYAMVAQTVADSAVTTIKLADASVTSGKVANGAITTQKLDASAQGQLVPSGLIGMFAGACPAGWTRFAALDNLFPMGGNTYGTRGGTATNTHAHGISTNGAHGHQLLSDAEYAGGGCGGVYNVGWQGSPSSSGALFPFCPGAGSTTYQAADSSTNSGGSHNHDGSTGNETISIVPPYVMVIWCQKD